MMLMKNLKTTPSYVHKVIRYYEGGSLINILMELCIFLMSIFVLIVSSAFFLGINFYFR